MYLLIKDRRRWVEGLAMVWVGAAIVVNLLYNVQNVNFWVDEAMLAYSISTRSLGELAAAPLAWNQSAPLLYVYIVKVISLVAGNSEFSLRLCSLVSYCLLLFMYFFLSKYVLEHKYPALETALAASVPILMGYSHEFKPYMTEACVVLGILILYYVYVSQKIGWYTFSCICSVLLLLGNPACFVTGGILCCECLSGIKERNMDRIRKSILGGLIVLAVFVVYYLFWLRPVIHDGYMVDFWKEYRFSFSGKAALVHSFSLITDILKAFGQYWIFICGGAAGCVLLNVFWERNKYIQAIFFTFAVSLFASLQGMFPLKDRLYLFAYPLILLLFFHLVNRLWNHGRIQEWIVLGGVAVLIVSQEGIGYYLKADSRIIHKEEIRTSIAWVEEKIEEDEACYVYWHALPAFWYEHGYENTSIGGYSDNLIWGKGFFHNGENQEDVEQIISSEKIYILISHINTSGDRVYPMLRQADDAGCLEKIMDNYRTPLYYYAKDKADGKFSARMEILDVETQGDICDVLVRIVNTGQACLNNGFETITLRTKEGDGQDVLVPVEAELAPGQSLDVLVHFKWESGVEYIDLHLKREGKFWMDEQGVAPVRVYRD